ncbi:MAG TPA: Rpn family recombination-promoting nuclease/putative transposase [Synergistales bacterium]|nr:Rpn family recombination-promoting nuclease/putative transposase [Synergistales bacterium]
MGDKDRAFRRLLADERLFLKFLRRFLKQNLPDVIDVEALTLDDLHREDITFIPPDLSERESDVLYRIRGTDAEAYVYVLVEHQSSVSHLMPFRLLSYVVQFWTRYVEKVGEASKRKDFLLPPVLPVVFYEGATRWTAPVHFAEKVRNASDFGKFIPAFEYRLISLRDKNPEALLSYGDALGALFYLANPSKTEGFLEAAERLRIFLLGLSDEERELTTNHLRGYLRILMKKEGLEIDDALDLCLEREEADVMLTYMQKEFRKARKEGREEGREEGQLEKGILMALAMLEAGEPEEKILRYTGLSPSQLEEIRDGRK